MIPADPITTLAMHLRAGEAPPIAWAVEWLDSDGRFPRAWNETGDLTAMRFILGSPYAGAIRSHGSLALLRGTASFVLSEGIFLQLACGLVTGLVVGGISRVGAAWPLGGKRFDRSIQLMCVLMGKAGRFCSGLSRSERLRIVDHLRREAEPPTLIELLQRLKIGMYAAKSAEPTYQSPCLERDPDSGRVCTEIHEHSGKHRGLDVRGNPKVVEWGPES